MQGYKYKGSSTLIYPPWERPFAGDFHGPFTAGFEPTKATRMFFAIALDTGECFAIGVKDRSAKATMIIFGELETEAGLDQPQDDDDTNAHNLTNSPLSADGDHTTLSKAEVVAK